MKLTNKIYVAGHNGLVGNAIFKLLKNLGYTNIITKSSKELDLRNKALVDDFFKNEKPQFVILAAAKVGGIHANNTYPADFYYDNICIQNNVIHAAYINQVEKLLFLGSSCIYPKNSPQPICESYLLNGYLEPTNEAYAIAKLAGIKMCQAYRQQYGCNFISVMPPNLYGPGDNYDLENAHVLPALLRKFHEAKVNNSETVTVWGSGTPLREFLFVEDMALACHFLMENYNSNEIINVGTGIDHTILQLAEIAKKVTGFNGEIVLDANKPDGTPRKLLMVDKINTLGWFAKMDLETGLSKTYDDFKENYEFYISKKQFSSQGV
jgi:GDP-L-fucose synthase